MRRAIVIAVVVLAGLLATAGPAGATTLSEDFETGPAPGTPITDQYASSVFTTFQQDDPAGGFRPTRRTVSASLAHSGTTVADVGADRCAAESPGAGSDCEFVTGGTTGRLTRTAQSVTVYAGLFDAPYDTVTAQLVGHRADGTTAATGTAVALDTSGFDKAVTVTSPAADIAYWTLVVGGPGAVDANVGFDDLTYDFPAGSLPDVSMSAPPQVEPVLQGQTTTVPITLTRLNGSNGDLALSVSGLPAGVTATLTPNPVTGTQTSATLKLTAAPEAPTFDVPQPLTVTADPQGDANVAPAKRTANVSLRVGPDFDLQTTPATPVVAGVPACTTVDVPFVLARDRAFTGTVTLAAEGLPPGVSAQILPSATIPPGGDFSVQGTLRLQGSAARVPLTQIDLRASSPGAPDWTLSLPLEAATPTATLQQTLGLDPRYLQNGTAIRVTGNGFCPGTTVVSGSAVAPAAVDPDGHGLTFTIPRGAKTGPVEIVPPSSPASYLTTNALTVRRFLGEDAFSFPNYPFGSLSLSELTDEFGADDLFIKVNPCGLWGGDCTVVTGFLNPIAAIYWPILDAALHGSGGHCFGMSRGVEELLAGYTSYSRFDSGVDTPFGLTGPTGPSSALSDWLDAKHAAQGSAEFLHAWSERDPSLSAQLQRIRGEFDQHRPALVTIAKGSIVTGEGHALLAYDLVDQPDGGVDVLVYDNNETLIGASTAGQGTIHIDSSRSHWSFKMADGSTWSGGSDGSLFAVPFDTIPKDPSLPGLSDLFEVASAAFGSANGAARTASVSPGARYLPVADSHAPPGTNGWLVAPRGATTLSRTVRGVRNGTYDEVFTGRGFAAGVTGVPTHRGVHDVASAIGRAHEIRFASGLGRRLQLEVAERAGGGLDAATIVTHASAGGSDTASIGGGGVLTYVHHGATTTFSLVIDRVRRGRGPTHFVSSRLHVASGDRITAQLEGARVRLVARHRNGRRATLVLRNRAGRAARLAVTRLAVRGRVALVAIDIRALRGRAALGVVLRVFRGRHRVARRVAALRGARNGRHTFRLRLPRLGRGGYRLRADVQLVAGGSRPGSVTAGRRGGLRVR